MASPEASPFGAGCFSEDDMLTEGRWVDNARGSRQKQRFSLLDKSGGGHGYYLRAGAKGSASFWFLLCRGSGAGRVDQRSGSDIRTLGAVMQVDLGLVCVWLGNGVRGGGGRNGRNLDGASRLLRRLSRAALITQRLLFFSPFSAALWSCSKSGRCSFLRGGETGSRLKWDPKWPGWAALAGRAGLKFGWHFHYCLCRNGHTVINTGFGGLSRASLCGIPPTRHQRTLALPQIGATTPPPCRRQRAPWKLHTSYVRPSYTGRIRQGLTSPSPRMCVIHLVGRVRLRACRRTSPVLVRAGRR